jgi:large subunit ribosomal protein L37Ae
MSTKRFGARYGKRVRDRLREIELASKKTHVCPYCRKEKVKRVASGIFFCDKCKAKFTGKAYTIEKPRPVEVILTSSQEEHVEEEDIEEEIVPQKYKDKKKEEPQMDIELSPEDFEEEEQDG